jgi:hypothetical protein
MTETGVRRQTSDDGPLDSAEILEIQGIVIPKRGLFARGICCFAADSKQIPCP